MRSSRVFAQGENAEVWLLWQVLHKGKLAEGHEGREGRELKVPSAGTPESNRLSVSALATEKNGSRRRGWYGSEKVGTGGREPDAECGMICGLLMHEELRAEGRIWSG